MNRLVPAPIRRVWTLVCDGVAVGSYTDCCERGFTSGDMLRDDRDLRRRVVEVVNARLLTLSVSHPDGMLI